MPGPTAEHGTRHSGLCRYWLAGPALSPTPALGLTSRSPALPLLGPAPPSVLLPWYISLHLTGLSHLSVSPSWLLSVFLSSSTALPLCLLSLPTSVSLHLCLSLISVSFRLCRPGWVRVGPGQPGPGAEANNAPFTRPAGAMATRPPCPPCARAARAKRMPWLRQAQARARSRAPPQPRAPLEGPGRQGAPGCSLGPESRGASPYKGPSVTQCLSFPFCKTSGMGRVRSLCVCMRVFVCVCE